MAAGFKHMSPRQMEAIRERVREEAEDGRFELCKTTVKHEGPFGREQHGRLHTAPECDRSPHRTACDQSPNRAERLEPRVSEHRPV